MVHPASELVHVRTDSDTITATPNHPFWVQGRGWVDAGLLASGDTLVLADGGRADIVSVTREKLSGPVDVYNLEVEDFHTYFVVSAGVWVHNCGGEIVTNSHHIVAQAAKAAEPARAVLEAFGIDVQGALNRVDITANTKAANILETNVHSILHTGFYYQTVNEALAGCSSAADVEAVLNASRAALLSGTHPR